MDDSITPSHNRVLAQRSAGNWMFLLEAARDMRTTGALAPSGKALARALTEPVRAQAGRPLNVLEAGAGTGAVTRALIPQLPGGSRLDIVEANPRFADRLRHLVRTHPRLAGQPGRCPVHHAYVERAGHRPALRRDRLGPALRPTSRPTRSKRSWPAIWSCCAPAAR